MTKLSTAAWTLHNLGLATSIGGTLFGQGAFQPALKDIHDPSERAEVSNDVWSRYSWWNLAAHGIVAATWFVGRTMLSGREVSSEARTLTKIKDGLVIASLATGIASIVLGRVLGARAQRAKDSAETLDGQADGLRRAVRVLGTANLVANTAIGAVTTNLAMAGNKSVPFKLFTRKLP